MHYLINQIDQVTQKAHIQGVVAGNQSGLKNLVVMSTVEFHPAALSYQPFQQINQAYIILFQGNGSRNLHPHAHAAANGITGEQMLPLMLQYHDGTGSMSWDLTNFQDIAAQVNDIVGVNIDGVMQCQILSSHHAN